MAGISREERERRQRAARAAGGSPEVNVKQVPTIEPAPAQPEPVLVLKVPHWMQGKATPLSAIQAGMQTWLDNQAERGLPLVISKD